MPRSEFDPDEVYLTTASAAELAGVKPATIRKWVEREHLVPVGRDGRGHMLFTQVAVANAEAKTRELARRPENIAA
ncbi:MerR family transcriptional regulator [Nonomuraea typhae]|uniref:MerR family transcriptional regulator n=1 Tax=Nonomuraea typhae TaxID=2603600 RepID=UPI0012F7609D|nr:MerR family transcriptional regulator [Nonomuraea typhae]